jgi:hypothetical protein
LLVSAFGRLHIGYGLDIVRVWIRKILLIIIVLLVVAQFVPVRHDNPPFEAAKTIFAVEKMPANVRAALHRSCMDCHSNETHWPWYSHVAPVSWMVASDVHEARRKMNFSQWADYPAKKRDHELEELCDEVSGGDMPDTKYTLIHRNARLTQQEHEAICTWTNSPPS